MRSSGALRDQSACAALAGKMGTQGRRHNAMSEDSSVSQTREFGKSACGAGNQGKAGAAVIRVIRRPLPRRIGQNRPIASLPKLIG